MNYYDKITEIFCALDVFTLEFEQQIRKQVITAGKRKRNRPSKLSDSEIMTILIYFHLGGFRNFKHFYCHYVCKHLQHDFPDLVSYNRFVELKAKVAVPLVLFLQNRCLADCTGISFIDSTSVKVCKNKRIKRNKVFKNIAKVGKNTMGWFFGFKLHLIINDKGEVLNFALTKANVDDRNQLLINNMSKNIFGKLFADKGYISHELFEILFNRGIHLFTHIRRNMKNSLMTLEDKILLRKRSVIETVNDELKNICQIEHSRHRSVHNFLMNILGAITAYCFLPKKPAIKVDWENTNQIALF